MSLTAALLLRRVFAALMAFLLPFYAAQATEEASVARGAKAAALCVACHQADGNGLDAGTGSPWPRLAGLDAQYISRQLQAFKDDTRLSPEMKPFASMLSAQQIADLSAYYASLPPKAPGAPHNATASQLAAGETLATTGDWNRTLVACADCHGPGNQGVGEAFPGIAGQHAAYLAKQLHAWQKGERTGEPLGLMHTIASRMNDDDIIAVSAWLATQKPATLPANAQRQP